MKYSGLISIVVEPIRSSDEIGARYYFEEGVSLQCSQLIGSSAGCVPTENRSGS